MKHLIALAISLILVLPVTGQAKQDVIASSGGYHSSPGLNLSWTLGETVIPTFVSADIILAHGFQPQLVVTAVEENINAEVTVKVYPNPASDIINIVLGLPAESEITVTLLDSNGRLVKRDVIEAAMTEKQLNMQDVPAGVYYLRLIKGKLVNVYKVIKL